MLDLFSPEFRRRRRLRSIDSYDELREPPELRKWRAFDSEIMKRLQSIGYPKEEATERPGT